MPISKIILQRRKPRLRKTKCFAQTHRESSRPRIRTQIYSTLSTTPELSPSYRMNSVPWEPPQTFITILHRVNLAQSHRLEENSVVLWIKLVQSQTPRESEKLAFKRRSSTQSFGGGGKGRGIFYNYIFDINSGLFWSSKCLDAKIIGTLRLLLADEVYHLKKSCSEISNPTFITILVFPYNLLVSAQSLHMFWDEAALFYCEFLYSCSRQADFKEDLWGGGGGALWWAEHPIPSGCLCEPEPCPGMNVYIDLEWKHI